MKLFIKILLVLLILTMPALFVTTAIRVALTPLFVNIEYHLPGFPADEYGFTSADRLTWSCYSINYLLGRESHEELANQRLPDGTPLYNKRELSHMLDVRNLTVIVLKVWLGLTAFFILVTYLCWITQNIDSWFTAVRRGGNLTFAFIFSILFYLVINFNQLFTQFHQLFFEGDSWLFLMSDNLIRLFPVRFWRDIFIFIGGLSILLGDLFIYFSKNHFRKQINKAQE
ncbi:MAG: TIGR01906 family membrane protein [Anaerolineaceae bacterium]|nr:TIGR01906 family membrane protein [Anaerolineaceae bacterium]